MRQTANKESSGPSGRSFFSSESLSAESFCDFNNSVLDHVLLELQDSLSGSQILTCYKGVTFGGVWIRDFLLVNLS